MRQLKEIDSGITIREATPGATHWHRYQLHMGDEAVSPYMTGPEIAAFTAGFLAARQGGTDATGS